MHRSLPYLAALGHLLISAALLAHAQELFALTRAGDLGAGLILAGGAGVLILGTRTTCSVLLAAAAQLIAQIEPGQGTRMARTALACAPAHLRQALAASLTGAVLTGAALSPALAHSSPQSSPGWPVQQSAPLESPGWPVTDRPAAQPRPQPQAPAASDAAPIPAEPGASSRSSPEPAPPEPEIVVAAGDTLWSIAASADPDAGDAALLIAAQQLYDANRDRIGPDPNLIMPGTHLEAPWTRH